MKGRESGMPDEDYWASFFAAEAALDRLLPSGEGDGSVVEFGCGYGTFTLPAARRVAGQVTTLDIEPALVELVRTKARAAALPNITATVRDFIADGSGLDKGSQSHAMIFNLLHVERPVALLQEARRVLRRGGSLSVIHWRRDIPTPRGPSLAIRPAPEHCRAWMQEAGFILEETILPLPGCPFHFGLLGWAA